MVQKSEVTTGRTHHVVLDAETVALLEEYGKLSGHTSVVGEIRGSIREALESRGVRVPLFLARWRKTQ
jgi:hypothetical protein